MFTGKSIANVNYKLTKNPVPILPFHMIFVSVCVLPFGLYEFSANLF